MALPMRIGWHGASLGISLWGFGQLDRMEALAGVDTSVQYGGHYQFLTICSLAATVATMSVALAQDLSEVVDVPGALRGSLALLKTFLSVVTMPTETLVSILFWTLFAIDPTLLVPPLERDDPNNPGQTMKVPVSIPLEIDLALHAAPAFFLLGDYLFFSPPFSKKMRPAAISACITVAYCLWVEHCAKKNGHFAYPILQQLQPFQRYGLYGLCALIFVSVLAVTQVLHKSVDDALGRDWKEGYAGAKEIETVKRKAVGKGAKRA